MNPLLGSNVYLKMPYSTQANVTLALCTVNVTNMTLCPIMMNSFTAKCLFCYVFSSGFYRCL